MSDNLTTLNVPLTSEQKANLRREAGAANVSMSEYVRRKLQAVIGPEKARGK